MFPTLFTFGKFSVSSFGVFLALAFLLGIFLIWRLARAWDLDEEKILDLTILTFFGGLIGARLYFASEHLQFFLQGPQKLLLLTKYPGFSFWGGFLGSWLTLYFSVRHFKMHFLALADIVSVGFLGGLIISNIGCFLGGCNVGSISKLFLAVPMEGQIGNRWPVQLFEAVLLLWVLRRIWFQATHFHQRGKIISTALIYLGLVKILLEPIKQVKEYFFDISLLILGITIFYKITGRNLITDLINLFYSIINFFTKAESRHNALQMLSQSWYNQKTSAVWKLKNLKKAARRLNVKFSYKNS